MFNGWKKLGITEKVKKEQAHLQDVIKTENIKNSQASNYYSKRLREKCFEEWRKFAKSAVLVKQIESEKERTKNRMEKFLTAVSEIKQVEDPLEYECSVMNDSNNLVTNRTNSSSRTGAFRRSKSFENEHQRPLVNTNARVATYKNVYKLRNVKTPLPRKKNNSNQSELIYQRDQSDDMATTPPKSKNVSAADLDKKVKEMIYPWVKTPFAVNNFDNRFKNQEKLLQEQHNMIKGSIYFRIYIQVEIEMLIFLI